jgi:RimJ/RimL family protein N-acetyltransferase
MILRRESVGDAELVAVAVSESLTHLAPWMLWATRDAATPEHQRDRLQAMSTAWEERRAFTYLLGPLDRSSVFGGIGLHRKGDPRSLEIGYWLHPHYVGRGYATASVQVVTQAALALPETVRVEIHCDVANERSQAIPRRLGFRLDRVEADEVETPAETGRSMVWVLEL